jgi:hypothetical protein
MAALILHINREAIHHGAEVSLLRDLYRASLRGGEQGSVMPAGKTKAWAGRSGFAVSYGQQYGDDYS